MADKIVFLLVVAVLAICEARRCDKKYKNVQGHSACKDPSPNAKDTGVSAEDIKLILKEHMRIRKAVKPPASNMREFTWDEELANTAEAWAEVCIFAHDKNYDRAAVGRFSVGQNIYMNTGKKDWKAAIEGWESEEADFNYNGAATGVVGHYTQEVWADTSKIGCGFANCKGENHYVCNYGPAGNLNTLMKTPWKTGKTCEECPNNCKDGICDCNGLVCLNGGILDVASCTCKCVESFFGGPLPFYKGDQCELDCIDVNDPPYCGSQFKPSFCKTMSNVPVHCPSMCGVC